ncbi:MAG TPA: hypothetical protein VEC39_21110 [Vicinamibacterales bacterium]|nr:hypothetical protein [Vicinamibacterales bacterium]
MKTPSIVTVMAVCAVMSGGAAEWQQQQAAAQDFKIVVIAGEGAVNIIQQKTAVAPVVEIRDRNNLPVPGVTVTFSVGSGSGATFGGASTLTATTNALGQATAAGLTPTAAGAVQVNVTAAVQGQTLSAAITQTNFVTAAQAAQAGTAAAGGGSGGSSAAGAAGGAAGGGGGIGLGTVGLIGAAVGGGAVAATQTGLLGGDGGGFIKILGTVYARATFGGAATACSGVFVTMGTSSTCYMEPAAGALVSTTLDSATATTDGAGHFDLTTTLPRSRIDECLTYTITIAAAGLPTYTVNTRGFSGNAQGNEHRQLFSISPPSPTFMGGGC